MSGKTHRVQVGEITCLVLHEGSMAGRGLLQDAFPTAPADEIDAVCQNFGQGDKRPESHMNALFIESGGIRILVDTGMGEVAGPNFGFIPAALQSEGISAGDIDIVFITHFHGDHFNGLLNEDGAPRYPNSRPITTQVEWDHWTDEAVLQAMNAEHAAGLRMVVNAFKDRFSFLNPGDTLAPGVTLVDMSGHSPGHTGLLIESNGEHLLDVVDLLHILPQFTYPHWHFVFDSDGSLAERSRKRMLARAADENLLTLFYHLPFPGLGHITRTDGGAFAFQPV
ncbi:MAG: MBL fold metallo-hydrolase [Anaerolineae bacterium]|nr:MBL fold metallo-hydrolase [Anaerolineae bacterium]